MVVAKKKTAVKQKADGLAALADDIVKMLKDGTLDEFLGAFDDALTERIEKQDEEAAVKKWGAKTTTPAATRTVPQPTRKSASKPSFVPDVNGTYVVAGGNKQLEGKKVKFLRFRKDDTTKAVVEMLQDAPGSPKGKKIIIPVSALKKPAAASRRVVKKGK